MAALLVTMAGAVSATTQHVYEEPSETDPWCEDGQEAVGTDKVNAQPIELDVDIGSDDFVMVCSGEQWDGQDPAQGDREDANAADTQALASGDIYVNPQGDCSGFNGGENCDQPDKKQRPTGVLNPLHVRVTGDVTGDSVTVYDNVEIWAVGQASPAVHVDTAGERGYVAVYLEDYTDDLFGSSNVDGDGNVLALIVDNAQSGVVAEDDCSQSTYETKDEDGNPMCARDNTAVTVELGWGWLP